MIEEKTLINKHLIDESRKSHFVGILIGLGVLVKDKNGKLVQGKNKWSKEKVLKKLKKRQKRKKIKNKLRSVFKK